VSVFTLRVIMRLDGNPFAPTNRCANTAHTVAHTEWIADDQGKVCLREDFDNDVGCCEKSISAFDRGCNLNCNETSNCCTIYEFCVACCMSPLSSPIVEAFKKQTRDLIYSSLLDEKDSFEFCKAKCRTSSNSVIGENKYRSVWKHCYGGSPPPLQVESRVVDQITISERKSARTHTNPLPFGADEEGEEGKRQGTSKQGRSLSVPNIEVEENYPAASTNPETYTVATPLSLGDISHRRATSSGALLGTVWWLRVLSWGWSSSDFAVALYVGAAAAYICLRSLL